MFNDEPKELGTMKKRLTAAAVGLAMIASMIVIATAGPASAAANVTATSVAINDETNCDDGDLDIGIDSDTVAIEGSVASTIGDDDIGSFEQPSTLSNTNSIVPYGVSFDDSQADGSIIGTWAYVGDSPPTSANAAEWFVLYRCDTGGANEVLFECFGDYGTCPNTADEAAVELFTVSVSPVTPLPGANITVTGGNCLFDVGGAVLSEPDGPALDSELGIEPDADGLFTAILTVPADVAPGTALEVFVGCGTEEEPLVSETIGITVGTPATTTTTAQPTTARPTETVRPRFTG